MSKKIFKFLFLIFPLIFICQKIDDSTLTSLASEEVKKNETIFNEILSYINLKNNEGKIFKYNFHAGNVEDYIFKPVYDSLVLARTPDSLLMKSSLLKYSYHGEKYEITKYVDAKQTIFHFNKYKNGKLIAKYAWSNGNDYTRFNFENNTSIKISKNDKNETAISYSVFRKEDINDIVYNKQIDYNGKSEEYLYYKDFPISNKRIVIKLANEIKKQKFILLNRKNYGQYTFKNKNGKFYSFKPENEFEIVNTLSGNEEINQLESSILNDKDIKVFKTYRNNKTPITKITTYDKFGILWEITINPKSADIINIEGEFLID